jgi:hypothetical protein
VPVRAKSSRRERGPAIASGFLEGAADNILRPRA